MKKKKKKYYVKYYMNFENTYELYYTETIEDEIALPPRTKRITRKEALRLAREEAKRQKYDPNGAYRADAEIYPAAYLNVNVDVTDEREFRLINRIYERI